ncbi:MAG: PD40 domain-containing protein [Actinobacteria bacterium]|nr:PD40 domain-containing protein [Actinomycetota bacterium]
MAIFVMGIAVISLFFVISSAGAFNGVIWPVSSSSSGVIGNASSSYWPLVSPDGRYVVFRSTASNLVAGDTNAVSDIFIKDTADGATVRVSTDAFGGQADAGSYEPSISPDNRYVVFRSDATNLIAGDTNGVSDIYLKDTQTGAISRVSTSDTGAQANAFSELPEVSAGGSRVIFRSTATNLVTGDTNGVPDVFIKETGTGAVIRVSSDASGNQADGNSGLPYGPTITPDGRYAAFDSSAANLVYNDSNARQDVFVKDTLTGAVIRVSTSSAGAQGDLDSYFPTLAADGSKVAFRTHATNLVTADTNGTSDVFMKDILTGATSRISTDASGGQAGTGSWDPFLSADGRYVTFASDAPSLVPGDTNNTYDVFVKDSVTGAIARVSLSMSGAEADNWSFGSSISSGGGFVAFESLASNLTPGDTNGSYDIFLAATQWCPGSRPSLSLARGSVYWASYADYLSRSLSVDFTVTNAGANAARNANVTGVSASGGVLAVTALPLSLGDITGGSSATATLKYSVPMEVASFTTSVAATSLDDCAEVYLYP